MYINKLLGFSVCLWLVTGSFGHTCHRPGWFGDNCQYMCHCDETVTCQSDGDCRGLCAGKWFGPKCQYLDVAYDPSNVLTDGTDSTCLDGTTSTQTIELTPEVRFTWMRLYIKDKSKSENLNITFLSSNDTVASPQSPLHQAFVRRGIFDIHGSFQKRIHAIRLSWSELGDSKFFCSLHVSGGRNVALKQLTFQSSDKSRQYSSEKAVDGIKDFTNNAFCANTRNASYNYWTLNFSIPANVNRYVIHYMKDGVQACRFQHFRLERSNEHITIRHTDPDDGQLPPIYLDLFLDGPLSVTSVNISLSTDYWPNRTYDCNNEIGTELTLCEVEIFGDSVCPHGLWGRQCELQCEFCNNDTCYVSTGSCILGCEIGHQGVGCERCANSKFWGHECTHPCSETCKYDVCDHEDGHCFHGCKPGFKGHLCEISKYCENPGWFGENCKFMCHCLNDVDCDSNGDCPGLCAEGWFGPQCQYIDLAYSAKSAITDGRDLTCLGRETVEEKVGLSHNVMFTWMRLVLSDVEKWENMSIAFLSTNDTEVYPQSPLNQVNDSDGTFDIHGSFEERIKTILLTWIHPQDAKFLCSVSVSGGRNVALHQLSSASSQEDAHATSESAVDGATQEDHDTGTQEDHDTGTQVDHHTGTHCAATNDAPFNYWALQISPPANVDRYVIYRSPDKHHHGCTHFRLERSNNETTMTYNGTANSSLIEQELILDSPPGVTSVNITVSIDYWPPGQCKNQTSTMLVLCEVQIFGESVCDSGRWGRQCEHSCDNCENKTCHVPTGTCPFGCAPGFHGVRCDNDSAYEVKSRLPIIWLAMPIIVVIIVVLGVMGFQYLRHQRRNNRPSDKTESETMPNDETLVPETVEANDMDNPNPATPGSEENLDQTEAPKRDSVDGKSLSDATTVKTEIDNATSSSSSTSGTRSSGSSISKPVTGFFILPWTTEQAKD